MKPEHRAQKKSENFCAPWQYRQTGPAAERQSNHNKNATVD
jgi:hypothetical protein